ncbi:MAG: glycosyltransferase family 2 protein [Thermodesulfobacteriota bacterium]
MNPIDVSFIIVNYNTGNLVIDCIRSIRQKTSGVNYEIIVVDNASTDGSCQVIESAFKDILLIKNPINPGFGAANNIGAKKATGRYLLMLNPDTFLLNNASRKMFDFMEMPKNGDVAVCSGVLTGEDGYPTVSFGDFPTPGKMIIHSLPSRGAKPNPGKGKGRKDTDGPGRWIVDFVSGADLFIRRSLFEKEGGFDDQYFAYYEETDLCKRISLKGYKAAIVREAKIVHLGGRSLKDSLKRKKIMYESSLRYLAKYFGGHFLFRFYCLVNEIKYRIYLDFFRSRFKEEDRTVLRSMVDLSTLYRRDPEQMVTKGHEQ